MIHLISLFLAARNSGESSNIIFFISLLLNFLFCGLCYCILMCFKQPVALNLFEKK